MKVENKEIANEVLIMIDTAIVDLNIELEKNEQGKEGISSTEILTKIIAILKWMTDTIKTDCLPPKDQRYMGLSRVVLDNWPINSKLGIIIFKIEELYKKL